MASKMGCLLTFVGLAAAGTVMQRVMSGPPSPPPLASYTLINEWSAGAAIALKDSTVVEAALRDVGNALVAASRRKTHWFVEVYSTPRAATMRNDATAGRLSPADERYWNANRVATYTRNATTGHHEYNMWLRGTSQKEPPITIRYPMP